MVRQIADFEAHGVYGFVIHPRVGLPRDIGWMSERMLHFVRFAVEEAERRGMYGRALRRGHVSLRLILRAGGGRATRRSTAAAWPGSSWPRGKSRSSRRGQNLVAVVERAQRPAHRRD